MPPCREEFVERDNWLSGFAPEMGRKTVLLGSGHDVLMSRPEPVRGSYAIG